MKDMIPAWVNGELKPVNKLEAHKLALRHKAISVFVIVGTETLIQQRALTKYHTPGLWANTCCSHPYWEESSLRCAVRRLKEELGITAPVDLNYRDQIEYKADVGNGLTEHELVDIFTMTLESKNNIEINVNPREVMAIRWITFDELNEEVKKCSHNFTPWIRVYLDQHLSQIFPN